jgi:hypothetical protein
LVQTIDLAPTLLDYFGLEPPADMLGLPVNGGQPSREACLFGMHGGHVNCTDGRYVYMRAPATPENGPLFNYTLMPTHMRKPFSLEELRVLDLAEPFSFTKGCRTLKVPATPLDGNAVSYGTLLFDLERDPGQEVPLEDPRVEQMMLAHLIRLMKENDAPPEQYVRLGLHWLEGASRLPDRGHPESPMQD